MTEYRQKILEHLVSLAKEPGFKQYAWVAAKAYGEIDPYQLKGLQEELKQAMLKLKGNESEVGSNRNGD